MFIFSLYIFVCISTHNQNMKATKYILIVNRHLITWWLRFRRCIKNTDGVKIIKMCISSCKKFTFAIFFPRTCFMYKLDSNKFWCREAKYMIFFGRWNKYKITSKMFQVIIWIRKPNIRQSEWFRCVIFSNF